MSQATDLSNLIGPLVSLDEWAELPNEVPGEIVEGRLVEEEMPDYLHEVIVAFLARVLGSWGDACGAVVATSEARFAVGARQGRKPDLTVFFAGRRPPRRGLVRIPPDIAVEIVSSGPRDARRDRIEKLGEYAAFGISWYWIVDPDLRTLEIHSLGDDRAYRLALQLARGVASAVPGCPGLVIDLDAMWAKLDDLGD